MINNSEFHYEISIIILTYNADFPRLRKTIISAILQEGITFEIIVADDGSKINHKEAIIELFDHYEFRNFKLVMNPENKGTIRNYLSAVKLAEGEYTRTFSSGDFLSGRTVLYDWFCFVKENNYEWSFSELIDYHMNNGEEEYIKVAALPLFLRPYIIRNADQIRWYYLVRGDIPVGCAMLGQTILIRKYLEELAKTGNLYAEDNIYRMMMFDGIVGQYYPQATIFYERGTGISNQRSNYWKNVFLSELIVLYLLLEKRDNTDEFQKRIQNRFKKKRRNKFTIYFLYGIKRLIKLHFFPRFFPIDFEATSEWREKCK